MWLAIRSIDSGDSCIKKVTWSIRNPFWIISTMSLLAACITRNEHQMTVEFLIISKPLNPTESLLEFLHRIEKDDRGWSKKCQDKFRCFLLQIFGEKFGVREILANKIEAQKRQSEKSSNCSGRWSMNFRDKFLCFSRQTIDSSLCLFRASKFYLSKFHSPQIFLHRSTCV